MFTARVTRRSRSSHFEAFNSQWAYVLENGRYTNLGFSTVNEKYMFTFCLKWQGFRDRWKVEDAVFVRPLNVRFVVDFIRCVYLSFLQVCSRLKSVIDDSPTLWVSASFLGVWPSLKNLPLLKRFAIVLCNGIQRFARRHSNFTPFLKRACDFKMFQI